MVAKIKFSASGTAKFLKVTDCYDSDREIPPISLQLTQSHSVTVSTSDDVNGLVKLEVSRNDKNYKVHEERKHVVDVETYTIDDSKLPPKDATITIVATGSDKYIRITDNISSIKEMTSWFQMLTDPPFSLSVATTDDTNGEIKVEVSKDGTVYNVHFPKMPVSNGSSYQIDDTSL